MAITKVQITHDKAGNLFWPGTPTKNQFINAFINFLSGLMSGVYSGGASGVIVRRTNAVKAVGTVTLATVGSGDVTATIGGTAVTVTYAVSDANTASLLATAVGEDATASTYVTAAADGATVVLTAKEAGVVGNAIGLTVAGTNVTADGSGFMGGTTAGSEDTAVSLNL